MRGWASAHKKTRAMPTVHLSLPPSYTHTRPSRPQTLTLTLIKGHQREDPRKWEIQRGEEGGVGGKGEGARERAWRGM
jgi:hypothetical protein